MRALVNAWACSARAIGAAGASAMTAYAASAGMRIDIGLELYQNPLSVQTSLVCVAAKIASFFPSCEGIDQLTASPCRL